MIKRLTTRTGFAAGAAICAALLGFGYYLQYVQGLNPCPLCYVQRYFFIAMLAIFAIGAVHGPRRTGAAIYGILAALFAAGGAAAASRQVWLQHLPADKVPQCGPDLKFMLKNLPLSDTLTRLVQGTGECAAVDWKFLGLSIAGWALVWFVVLAAYALWLGIRRTPIAAASAAASR
ncbi:MAG TPA: disulfide bond formation protein B [Burkholderiales bacterium]|nr:disulfide bond formation protein B [Burkholderiales bacterium]